MNQYIVIFILIAFLAFVTTYFKKRITNNILLFIISVILILFAGTRFEVGYDYFNYEYIYNNIKLGINSFIEPFFILVNKISHYIGIEYTGLVFAMAFASISLKTKFISNFSVIPLLSLLLYYSRIFLIYDFGQIRQGLALGIVLFSLPYILNKDIKRFLFIILLASLFHFSAAFFTPIYFINNIKLKRSGILYILLLSCVIAFMDLKPLIINLGSFFLPGGVIEKLLFYSVTEDKLGLTFGILLRVGIIIICITLFWKKIKENNLLKTIFNIYLWGTFFYLCLNSFPQIGNRGSMYFQQFEIVLFPHLILYLSKNRLLQFLFLLFIIFYCYWGFYTALNSLDVFIPYNSILF